MHSLDSSLKSEPSPAHEAFLRAKKVYQHHGLQGSDHKGIVDQSLARVVGGRSCPDFK